jgi:hypothetical protein
MNFSNRSALFVLLAAATVAQAEPPTDPKARKIYDHNYNWLKKSPPPFVATNIRGQGMAYAERRQAALDLVREQRDFGVVSELMNELDKGSFLSGQIIDILVEWKARRSLPLLKKIADDPKRDKEIREKARAGHDLIANAPLDRPPTF